MLHGVHLHFLGEINFNSMPTGEQWHDWMNELVDILGMNIMFGPKIMWCDTVGNEGHTGLCIIDTSHLTFHAWEEGKFAKMDIYSCKDYSIGAILDHLKKLDVADVSYTMLDRTIIRYGGGAEAVACGEVDFSREDA